MKFLLNPSLAKQGQNTGPARVILRSRHAPRGAETGTRRAGNSKDYNGALQHLSRKYHESPSPPSFPVVWEPVYFQVSGRGNPCRQPENA
jgi:hypothetical protein